MESIESSNPSAGSPFGDFAGQVYAQQEIPVFFKERRLKKSFIPDFVFFEKIIVEIKAIDKLTGREESQLLNYLKATQMPLGLLINFGAPHDLEWKRMVGNDATIYRVSQSRRYICED